MILLLSKLRRDKPFEEVFFYLDLFEALRAKGASPTLNIAPIPVHLIRRQPCSEVWGPQPFVQMVLEGYRGFNVIRWRITYYAIAQDLGPIDVTSLGSATVTDLQNARRLFLADSLQDALCQVDRADGQSVPELVSEGYRGFNIVAYNNRFYGLAQVLGPVDLARMPPRTFGTHQGRGLCVVGASLAEVKRQVGEVSR
jgi:hypothetical protein